MSITNYDPGKSYPIYAPSGAMPCAEHWEKWVDQQDADPKNSVQCMVMVISRTTLRLMLERIPEAFVSLPPCTEEEPKAQRLESGRAE